MQKSTDSHRRRKGLSSLIIVSFLVLALLVIFLETASGSSLEPSTSPEMGHVTEQMPAGLDGARYLIVTLTSYQILGNFEEIGLGTDVLYMLGGIGIAVLTLIIYPRVTSRETKLRNNFLNFLHSLKIRKSSGVEEVNSETSKLRKSRLFISIPILCIALAEILIFLGEMEIAVWVHIGTLIALSVSSILVKDSEIQKIHQALMLLPVLRLINLSMPVFFDKTLYAFIFIYGTLAIPVAVIIIHQRYSFDQIGISMKNINAYMVLSIPLSLVLGFGEYLTIKTEYLIPDLTFESLLKLSFIMVFFVGLIEELIFRSILQTRLEQTLNIKKSLLITSLLFGLMHSGYGTFYEIFYTSFIGLLMGLTFHKTRSLPFITVLHGFINVFLFGILPYYLKGWTGF